MCRQRPDHAIVGSSSLSLEERELLIYFKQGSTMVVVSSLGAYIVQCSPNNSSKVKKQDGT